MGGFVLCNEDGQPTKTLSFSHFKNLVRQRSIDFPHLTSLEIQERSKIHPALTLIALLQATWFIAQCLSRFITANPMDPGLRTITQWEAITATLVVANWCIYCFAWRKPLDVQYVILIKPIVNPSMLRNRDRLRCRGITAFEREDSGSQITECRYQLEFPQTQWKSITRLRLARFLVSIIRWPVQSIYNDITRLVLPDYLYDAHEYPDGTLKIPLFYVQNMRFQYTVFLPAAVLGMGTSIVSFLFVLHSGSTLYLSSQSIRVVWRIASITSTSFSALTLCFIVLVIFCDLIALPLDPNIVAYTNHLQDLLSLCLAFFISLLVIGVVPFLLARVVLLVASVICLWSVQGNAFVDRSWTHYIPHLF